MNGPTGGTGDRSALPFSARPAMTAATGPAAATPGPAVVTPSDAAYHQSHLIDAPAVIRAAIDRHRPAPATILDFGCGLGLMTLALALAYPQAEVLGVDLHDGYRRVPDFCRARLDREPPANLRFQVIAPGASLRPLMSPDVVCSWSVIEHVSRPLLPAILADIHAALAPGGIVFTQICPLYHAPFGSHLGGFTDQPWHHLIHSHAELRGLLIPDPTAPRPAESAAWMFQHYEELNRITAEELAALFAAAGLDQVQDRRRLTDRTPPKMLRDTFRRDALLTEELVFVHRRGQPGRTGRRRSPSVQDPSSLYRLARRRVGRWLGPRLTAAIRARLR